MKKTTFWLRVLTAVWLLVSGLVNGLPLTTASAAAPRADLNAPQAVCVNPLATATLARRDDIILPLWSTTYSQPSYAWGSWGNGMLGNVSNFSAVDRNRMIEYAALVNGSITHAWLAPDSSLAGRDLTGQVSLGSPSGLSFSGRPELLIRTSFEMWVIARASNNTLWYKAWKNATGLPDGSKWNASWLPIPNVSNAAGGLTAVFRDTNHLEVFYKDTSGQAYFIEWAFGQWMQAPVYLNGSFSGDMTAFSLNSNQMGLLATDANSGLYFRQWTADKQPDWSDVPYWEKPVTGLKVQKPAISVLDGDHLAVALLNTGGYPLYLEYDRLTHNWTSALVPGSVALASPLAIQRIDAQKVMLVGVISSGTPYASLRLNGVWQTQQMLNGGLSASAIPVLVNWEPGEVVLVGLSANSFFYNKAYTAYMRSPTWNGTAANIAPAAMQGPPANRYALLRKFGTPYMVWLEKLSSGLYMVRSRANPLTSANTINYQLPLSDIDGIALLGKDLLGDDFDRIVVAVMTKSKYIYLYLLDPQNLSLIAQVGPGQAVRTGTTSLIAVDAGDLDGDGKKNEIGLAFLGGENDYRYTTEVYRFKDNAVSLLQRREMAYGVGYYYNSVAVAIGSFDPYTPNQDLMMVGDVVVNTGSQKSFGETAIYRLNGSTLDFITGSPALTSRSAIIWGTMDIAAVDLDGDGRRELAASVFMPTSASELHVLNYDGAKINLLSTVADAQGPGQRIEAGDLNGDGLEEIVGSYSKLRVYRQKAGASSGQLSVAFEDTAATNIEFITGDMNNDSVSMTGDGCEDFRELTVLQILNAPPRWYPGQGAGAAYAKSAYSGKSEGSTTSNTQGGSLTVGFDYEQAAPIIGTKIGGVRASVSQDFAFARSQSKEEVKTDTWSSTYEFDQSEGGNGQTGMVIYSQTKFRCYFFRASYELPGTRSMKVCSHLGVGTTGKSQVSKVSFEQWRSDAFKSSAGTSWANVGAPTNSLTGANGYLTKTRIPATHFPIVKEFTDSASVVSDVFPSKTTLAWDNTQDKTIGTESSWETNTTISAGVTAGVLVVDGSFSFGFSGAKSSATTEGSGQTYDAKFYDYDPTACKTASVNCTDYSVKPYIYLRTVKTQGGETYQVHELDYYLTGISDSATQRVRPQLDVLVSLPEAPLVSSSTHPDPNVWYPSNTVTLSWAQPAGDQAVVTGYDWEIDPDYTYAPTGFASSMTQTITYQDVDEGANFFSVMAEGNTGQFGALTRRQVLVDTQPPTVKLQLSHSPDETGWMHEALEITIRSEDGVGSGVALIEYSLDGSTWLPYTGPLTFASNTPTTTLRARATDLAGHTSEPVSTTFHLDVTPPALALTYLRHTSGATGNSQVVLGGTLADDLSGLGGVEIALSEGGDYYGAQEIGEFAAPSGSELPGGGATLNWLYTPSQVVRGSYNIVAYGSDLAGNPGPAQTLGTLAWAPTGTPDYSQSVLSSDTDGAQAGDTVHFVLAVRNTGTQESALTLSATLPDGLNLLPETISDGGAPAGQVIHWRLPAIWPGETHYLFYSASVGINPTSTTLLHTGLLLRPYYPDVLNLYADPAEQTVTHELKVMPTASGAQPTPQVLVVRIEQGDWVSDRHVQIEMEVSPNTRFYHVNEYTLAQDGAWTLAQSSGWQWFINKPGLHVDNEGTDLEGALDWTLSPGDGVKMLEIRAANGKRQVSDPNPGDIIYTNLIAAGGASLAAGEHVQYRIGLRHSTTVTWTLGLTSGDADLYAWQPRSGQAPDYIPARKTATEVVLSFAPPETGVYILEVHATTATTYTLTPGGDLEPIYSIVSTLPSHGAESSTSLPVSPISLGIPILQLAPLPPVPQGQKIFLPMIH